MQPGDLRLNIWIEHEADVRLRLLASSHWYLTNPRARNTVFKRTIPSLPSSSQRVRSSTSRCMSGVASVSVRSPRTNSLPGGSHISSLSVSSVVSATTPTSPSFPSRRSARSPLPAHQLALLPLPELVVTKRSGSRSTISRSPRLARPSPGSPRVAMRLAVLSLARQKAASVRARSNGKFLVAQNESRRDSSCVLISIARSACR